jgi:hypothetical protein
LLSANRWPSYLSLFLSLNERFSKKKAAEHPQLNYKAQQQSRIEVTPNKAQKGIYQLTSS